MFLRGEGPPKRVSSIDMGSGKDKDETLFLR